MKCPRDNTELSPKNGKIEILICPECQGLFIKNEAFRKLIDKILEKNPTASENAAEYLASPYDGKAMIPIKIKNVTVDLCKSSGYIWFDRGEYEKLADMLYKKSTNESFSKAEVALEVADIVTTDTDIIGGVFEVIGDGFGKITDLISFGQ